MFLKTIQASAFKNIFEVLKDILNDVNVSFSKKGIHMLTLDNARTAMVELFLDANQFEEYSCENEIIVGINTTNVFRVLKSVTTNDVLVMKMRRITCSTFPSRTVERRVGVTLIYAFWISMMKCSMPPTSP